MNQTQIKCLIIRYLWLMGLVRLDQFLDLDYSLSVTFLMIYIAYISGKENTPIKEFNSKIDSRLRVLCMFYQLFYIGQLSLMLYLFSRALILLGLGSYLAVVIELPSLVIPLVKK